MFGMVAVTAVGEFEGSAGGCPECSLARFKKAATPRRIVATTRRIVPIAIATSARLDRGRRSSSSFWDARLNGGAAPTEPPDRVVDLKTHFGRPSRDLL